MILEYMDIPWGCTETCGMVKFFQDTIWLAYFISIPTNNKFDNTVRYIHDNNLWGSMRVLRLEDRSIAEMEKIYDYSRMTKQCIEKTISDIGYQKVLSDISSPTNIWNKSDTKSYLEESSSNDYSEYLENICFVILNLCNEG